MTTDPLNPAETVPCGLAALLTSPEISGDDYVAWACAELGKGVDSPSLRILAGLSRGANPFEAETHFRSALGELHIELPEMSRIRLAYLRCVAEAIAGGTISPDEGIALIHRRVVSPLGHREDVMRWCRLWEGISASGRPGLDDNERSQAIRAEAVAFLTRNRSGGT